MGSMDTSEGEKNCENKMNENKKENLFQACC